jgi:hypothetical protein
MGAARWGTGRKWFKVRGKGVGGKFCWRCECHSTNASGVVDAYDFGEKPEAEHGVE